MALTAMSVYVVLSRPGMMFRWITVASQFFTSFSAAASLRAWFAKEVFGFAAVGFAADGGI